MRKLNALVFDEFVSNATQVFTSQALNDRLGMFDHLTMHAVVDNVAAANATFTAQIQHSADNRNFLNKNTNAEINAVGVPQATTTSTAGGDTSSLASLGFVRIAITLGGANVAAHVKLYVAARDDA